MCSVGPTIEKITSLQNPRVKQLVKLRDRRPRDEAGVFLVEGYREIRRALEKGVALEEIYFSPEWFLGENEPALIAQAQAAGAELKVVFSGEGGDEAFAAVPLAMGKAWICGNAGGLSSVSIVASALSVARLAPGENPGGVRRAASHEGRQSSVD